VIACRQFLFLPFAEKKWREKKGNEGLVMEERGRGNVVFLGQKFFNT